MEWGVAIFYCACCSLEGFLCFELDCRRFISANGVDILWEHAIYNDLILHSWAVIYTNWKLYYPTLFDLLLPLGLISSILDLG